MLGTGDELVAPGAKPAPGEIVYSNGFALLAMARSEGAEVNDLGVARDDAALSVDEGEQVSLAVGHVHRQCLLLAARGFDQSRTKFRDGSGAVVAEARSTIIETSQAPGG